MRVSNGELFPARIGAKKSRKMACEKLCKNAIKYQVFMRVSNGKLFPARVDAKKSRKWLVKNYVKML